MANRLLGLATRDAKRTVTVSTFAAAESFADVGTNRLRGVTQLCDVNEPMRATIDESVYLIRHLVRSIEYGEIAMIAHAQP